MSEEESEGMDLIGLGKVAKAIPPEVYTQNTETTLGIFEKLVSPITETTAGFGRYIRQVFDNMVEVRKALGAYSLQNAVHKAEEKSRKKGIPIISPVHHKSFVKVLEEASKETDPLLHEMWENLLADQLTNSEFHPHFVEILPHFSPAEAQLLLSLRSRDDLGDHGGGYISFDNERIRSWVRKSGDRPLLEWNYSCVLLLDLGVAGVLSAKTEHYPEEKNVTILHRTMAGDDFLAAVSRCE